MESLDINKALAGVLTAGIAFMGATILSDTLVHPRLLKDSVLKIEIAAPAATTPPGGSGGDNQAQAVPIAQMLASADPARGSADTQKLCAACHSFNEGGKAGVGPNLYGVVGGPHAHMEGYSYSSAIQAMHDKPWTFDELNAWLTKPQTYAPGTKMGFAGINSVKDRADVIAYLNSDSKNPLPMPAAAPASDQKAAGGGGNAEVGTAGAAPAQGQDTPASNAPGQAAAPAAQGGAPAAGSVPQDAPGTPK